MLGLYLKDINTPKFTTQQKNGMQREIDSKRIFQYRSYHEQCQTPRELWTYQRVLCLLLVSLLVDTLNYAFQYDEFSTSQRQAVITLIEK